MRLDFLHETALLIGAVLFAFAGMVIIKSSKRTAGSWAVRFVLSIPLFIVALCIVLFSIPYPLDPGVPTLSIVGSAVLVAGLAAEELVGADVRRKFGF